MRGARRARRESRRRLSQSRATPAGHLSRRAAGRRLGRCSTVAARPRVLADLREQWARRGRCHRRCGCCAAVVLARVVRLDLVVVVPQTPKIIALVVPAAAAGRARFEGGKGRDV